MSNYMAVPLFIAPPSPFSRFTSVRSTAEEEDRGSDVMALIGIASPDILLEIRTSLATLSSFVLL